MVPVLGTLTELIKESMKKGYCFKDLERIRSVMDQLQLTKTSPSEIIFNLCFEAEQLEGVWQEIQVGKLC